MAARAAGADGKNAVVKAYHSNIIPTESVSTGKKISEKSCVIYKRTKSCKYSPFFYCCPIFLMQIQYIPRIGAKRIYFHDRSNYFPAAE
jgi:hypothetical protein